MALTNARMLELAQEHEKAEISLDLDWTMATLVAHPIYYWFPHRLKIEGPVAVREMYRRLGPVTKQMEKAINDGNRNVYFMTFGENQLAAEIDFDYRFDDGSTKKIRIAAFLPFEGEKMVGETQYVDADLARVLDKLFDREFRSLPGVSLI